VAGVVLNPGVVATPAASFYSPLAAEKCRHAGKLDYRLVTLLTKFVTDGWWLSMTAGAVGFAVRDVAVATTPGLSTTPATATWPVREKEKGVIRLLYACFRGRPRGVRVDSRPRRSAVFVCQVGVLNGALRLTLRRLRVPRRSGGRSSVRANHRLKKRGEVLVLAKDFRPIVPAIDVTHGLHCPGATSAFSGIVISRGAYCGELRPFRPGIPLLSL